SYTGPWPIVSIWHGDADYTVNSSNLREAMEAWTNVHGIDQSAEVSGTVKGYPHRVYQKNGVAVVETYLITGMGHGTPVDPGSAEDGCGQAGAYILDVNICSSYHIGHFWG
ncbi:MAG: esterase, partial [Deinococcota bacterium]|nr:esterase [Deinococcota bacterium]